MQFEEFWEEITPQKLTGVPTASPTFTFLPANIEQSAPVGCDFACLLERFLMFLEVFETNILRLHFVLYCLLLNRYDILFALVEESNKHVSLI